MTDSGLQQKRLIAAAIDVGILIAVSTVLSLGAVVISCAASATKIDFLAVYGTRVVMVFLLLADLLLVLGRDLTGGDRSMGKKLINVRVTRTSGEPIAFMDSLKRNALFTPGLVIGVITAVLSLIPFAGCVVYCLFLVPRILAGLAALGAVVWEIIQIVQQPDGVRMGDKMADTRVTW